MRVQHSTIENQHRLQAHQLSIRNESDSDNKNPQSVGPNAHTTMAAAATNALLLALDSKAREHQNHRQLVTTTQSFQDQFAVAASDQAAFHNLMAQSFGANYDYDAAEAIRLQTLAGDFTWMPSIQIVDASMLADTSGTQGSGTGLAAYSSQDDTIYISSELLLGPTDQTVALLTEEVGHALDNRLNEVDSAGDEGELFALLVAGNDLSQGQIDALRAENDHGTIVINGEEQTVEYGWLSDAWDSFTGAVDSAVDTVSDGINSVGNFFSNGINSAGNLLSDGLDLISDNIITPVLDFVPGGSWINDHVVRPVFGMLNTGISIGTNIIDSGVDILTHAADGLVNVTGNLLVGDFSGAWDATLEAGQNLLEDSVGVLVETFAIGANGLADMINDSLGLTETRGLTADEKAYLETIYGNSIDYDEITIQQGGGLEELIGMDPHAITNDIYMPDGAFNPDGTLTQWGLQLLSHEVGHVWQYQNDGANYITEAVGSYINDRPAAYDYESAITNRTPWDELTPDQQAEFAKVIGMAIATHPQGILTVNSLETAIDNENGTAPRPNLTQADVDYIIDFQNNLLNGVV